MTRYRTRKLIIGILGGLALLAACILMTGCVSAYPPDKTYRVEAFTVVVTSPARIVSLWLKHPASDKRDTPSAFFDPSTRTCYVPYASRFGLLPMFFELGHEVWHLPELGGRFHD